MNLLIQRIDVDVNVEVRRGDVAKVCINAWWQRQGYCLTTSAVHAVDPVHATTSPFTSYVSALVGRAKKDQNTPFTLSPEITFNAKKVLASMYVDTLNP